MGQYEEMDSELMEDIYGPLVHFDEDEFNFTLDYEDEFIDVKRKVKSKEVNRKDAKQISFRVSDQEYLKLKESAENLNLSVPMFVKKKAQGIRLITPKLDLNTRKKIANDLSAIGNNINQISKWFNSNQDKAMYLSADKYNDLENQFKKVKEELHEIWQQLN